MRGFVALKFLKLTTSRWPKCNFCVEAKPHTWELAQILLGTVDPSCCRQVANRAIQAPAPWPTPVQTTATLQWNGKLFTDRKHELLPRAWMNSLHPASSLKGGADSRWFLLTQREPAKVSAMLIPKQRQGWLLQVLLHPSARAASEGRHL